jgi:hypothetical protein
MAWNGTYYEINAHGHATDVVGFAYLADEWCPRCTLGLIGSVSTLPPLPAIVESEIKLYGTEIRDLDVAGEDPRWRDSDTIPQPIFNGDDARDNNGRARTCAGCYEPLLED